MSSSISEPLTHGKVVLTTTLGDFDVELWSKEAPLACRHFIQLCLDRYYDKCAFYRVAPGFVAQSGDPTNTDSGGVDLYKDPTRSPAPPPVPGLDGSSSNSSGAGDLSSTTFKTEVNSRLRYNRAGLVGLAGSAIPDSAEQAKTVYGAKQANDSRFFFTLGATKWLDGKNTLFGTITGDTRYESNQ